MKLLTLIAVTLIVTLTLLGLITSIVESSTPATIMYGVLSVLSVAAYVGLIKEMIDRFDNYQ